MSPNLCRKGCVATRCSTILKNLLENYTGAQLGGKPVLEGQPGLLHHKISADYPCEHVAVLKLMQLCHPQRLKPSGPASAAQVWHITLCCLQHPCPCDRDIPATSLLTSLHQHGLELEEGRAQRGGGVNPVLPRLSCELICSLTLLQLHAQGCSLGGHFLAYKTSIVIEICRYWELEAVFSSHLSLCRGSSHTMNHTKELGLSLWDMDPWKGSKNEA